jgi:hypothetical protein
MTLAKGISPTADRGKMPLLRYQTVRQRSA